MTTRSYYYGSQTKKGHEATAGVTSTTSRKYGVKLS